MAKKQPKKGKAKGSSILSRPKSLWGVDAPWTKRPKDKGGGVARALGAKTRADSIRSMAEGWRPPSVAGGTKYELLEQNATVWGGLKALKLAGIPPWADAQFAKIPSLAMAGKGTKRDKTSEALLLLVRKGAGQAGSNSALPDIDAAATYIRKQVQAAGLDKVAWASRGALLTRLGVKKLKLRGGVEAGTASALMSAGLIMHAVAVPADASVVGLVVGIPLHAVGGMLNATSAVMTGLQGRSKIELVRTQAAEKKFRRMIKTGLEERGLTVALRQAEAEAEEALAATQAESKEIALRVKQEALQNTQTIQVITAVGVAGALVGLMYVLSKRRKE
jgi:hypothetical protein